MARIPLTMTLGAGAVQREIPQLRALTRTDTGVTTTIQSREIWSLKHGEIIPMVGQLSIIN